MKIGSTVMGILVGLILVGLISVVALRQHASAFGFVESQQIGEFRKLTGEFVQKVINRQQSPNSEGVAQFRVLTVQLERDIINAVLNDHLSLIPGLLFQYKHSILDAPLLDLTLPEVSNHDFDGYTQEVLRIFCKPCV